MLYTAIKEAKTMYTVKEVADILGVSVHTVRYYDDQGLIPGTKRDSYNQRIFDDMELEWLFVSISLRDTGLPLKEIKRYIELYQQGDSTLQQRFEIMSKQREKTLEEIENLKLRIKVLDRKVDHYAKLLAGKLDYGKGYSIVEVQAPYGYVLDDTPVYFDITEENSTEEGGVKGIMNIS